MYNPFSLLNKTVFVTGASSGIGKAIAIECAKMGAKVLITGRNEERLKATFQEMEGEGHHYYTCDLSIEGQIEKMITILPVLDGVVHSAGISNFKPFQFLKKEDFNEMFDINFFAPSQVSIALLKAKKINKNASIVFITSISGILTSYFGGSLYSSTKGALNGILKGMALDLSQKKIRVNGVMPAMVQTDILNSGTLTEEQVAADIKKYPMGRYGNLSTIRCFGVDNRNKYPFRWGENNFLLIMKAFVNSIAYYLPEKIISNDNLVEDFPEWTAEKVASKIGVKKRHIVSDDEFASDLAVRAAEKLFADNQTDRSTIDFILYCTQSPDYILPTTACLLQSRLNLPITTGALDFNLGCSGYVYGLSLAKGLIAGGIAKNVLLITAETYSKHIHPKDKGNRTIFGDAAAATLISTAGFAEIGNFSLGTDGTGAENLMIKTGGTRFAEKLDDLHFDESNNPLSSDHLYMNGTEIFNFTLEFVPVLVEDTLKRNQLAQEQINLFVFHQANKFMMNFLRKKVKIEEDKFYYYLEEVGNTVSSTIPIALFHAKEDGLLKGNVLLAGFGVGYSWAGTVLKM
jgi:3-oxoacyl-[acyl-carrier-protein] synthase-3